MISKVSLNALALNHNQHCQRRLVSALLTSFTTILLALLLFYYKVRLPFVGDYSFGVDYIALALLSSLCMLCAIDWLRYARLKSVLSRYTKVLAGLEQVMRATDHERAREALLITRASARKNPLALAAIAQQQPELDTHIENLTKADLSRKLRLDYQVLEQQCNAQLAQIKSQVPLIKAESKLCSSMEFIRARRSEISQQWKDAYEKFSWWNKLKYAGESPDFSEMHKIEYELKKMHAALMDKHATDLEQLDSHFDELKASALARLAGAETAAMHFIAERGGRQELDSDLLKKALWFSALSLPVSAWADMDAAGSVYDALRQVNGNFSAMSDTEIWWETLFMPTDSLVGLAALTKGAYFEQLVAADTGGTLFEHFNNPDTDIVIGGIAYQLKATDSASYVNSVDENIPVISTSEVSFSTGSIDSGFSNEDLTNSVDLALGGAVIDIGDSAADAILAGVGGLGLFATIAGINHAANKHANGGDGVEAMFEGVGVAIEGTARSLVGAAEMTYKVLASRPSRFVGRVLLKGLKKLDDKMTGSNGVKY